MYRYVRGCVVAVCACGREERKLTHSTLDLDLLRSTGRLSLSSFRHNSSINFVASTAPHSLFSVASRHKIKWITSPRNDNQNKIKTRNHHFVFVSVRSVFFLCCPQSQRFIPQHM